jgi:hypothetical protein
MPHQSHSSRFHHQHNIGWGVQSVTNYVKFVDTTTSLICFSMLHVYIIQHWSMWYTQQ